MDSNVLRDSDRAPKDKSLKCAQCGQPRFRQARCWKHFVRRFALRRNFTKNIWWKTHERSFLVMLQARYKAILMGLEVPEDNGDFIYLFQHGADPLQDHSFKQIALLDKMVTRILLHAKKEYYVKKYSDRGKEDGRTV